MPGRRLVPGNQLAQQNAELRAFGTLQRAHNALLGAAHRPLHLQRQLFAFGRDPE